ncbi:MAG: DedA family protein [Alphaproteobacteria bacterium]|nr:DedA family protein [Alphaproteobacteria bacterium]
MLRRLYDWTLRLADTAWAPWALAFVAFVESSVFPIPPDVLLIPMVLVARAKAWRLAAICTVASVAGGFAGYGIGYGFYASVGQPIVEFYGYSEAFAKFAAAYNEWGAWIVAFFGVTPFPYKVVTIASGVTALDPFAFGIASLVSRGARFFLVAALLWYVGPPIRAFIERRLGLVTLVFAVLLVGGFVAVAWIL